MRKKPPVDEPEDLLYLRIKEQMRADIASRKWSQPEAAAKVLGMVDKDGKAKFEKWLKPRDDNGKVRKIPITAMRDWSDYFNHNWELFSLGRLSVEERKVRGG